MFYSPEFWIRPHERVLPDAGEPPGEQVFHGAVVIFYHAEAEDMGREEKIISKWVKNAKWIAGKFATKTVILHSFNHLSHSKAPVDTALHISKETRRRLEGALYSVYETPFGYLNEWKMHVSGESLAKVFKEI
jgi:hypothetical protein